MNETDSKDIKNQEVYCDLILFSPFFFNISFLFSPFPSFALFRLYISFFW